MNPVPTKAWVLRRVGQVLVGGARERVRRTPALSAEDVPRSPEEISAEWLTAVLCRDTPGARVSSVTAIGLQGSWAHDCAYIIASALEVEDRRAWERDLLDFYLERLAAAGGGRIARDTAWHAYRRAMFYPYLAWVYTIGRSRLQPEFQPDETSLAMIGRIAAAIDDLDSPRAVGL